MNPTGTKAGRGVIITSLYLMIALVMTHPLWLHFNDYALIGLEDGSMSYWNIWWSKFSLFQSDQTPLYSTFLFSPDGASLTFHSYPKIMGMVSVPLQYLGGTTFGYNIIFLLSFVLTGLATYWLAFHLMRERIPAFFAGAFFAFSPIRWNHIGHLQLLSTMLIPVYILLLFKGRETIKKDGKIAWGYAFLAGLTLTAIAYDTEYYAFFLIFFSFLFLLFFFPFKWSPAAFRRWSRLSLGMLISGVTFLLLFLPMLLAARWELAENGDYVSFPPGWASLYSRDLFSFVVPQQTSRYLGSFFANFTSDRAVDVVFLGWLPILLALIGIWLFRRRGMIWFWVVTMVSFGVLALGPVIKIGNRSVSGHGPYLLITKLPVINAIRVPARFSVMTMLALAILAGFGISALTHLVRNKGWTGRRVVVGISVVILLGIYVEYEPVFHLTSTDAPQVYKDIASSDLSGSVITLPMGWEGGAYTTGIERTYAELFQTEHERPIVGGMLARVQKEKLYKGVYTPVIDFLADPVHLMPSDLDKDPKAIAGFKDRFDVAYIVAHKVTPDLIDRGNSLRFPTELTPEALDRIDKYITGYLGMEKFAEDEEIVAYRQR